MDSIKNSNGGNYIPGAHHYGLTDDLEESDSVHMVVARCGDKTAEVRLKRAGAIFGIFSNGVKTRT